MIYRDSCSQQDLHAIDDNDNDDDDEEEIFANKTERNISDTMHDIRMQLNDGRCVVCLDH